MSALAGTYNITADQGATFTLTIFRKDRRKRLAPFTASEVRMQVRERDRTGSVIIEATTGNGRIVVDGPKARIDITISHTVMESVLEGSYTYDLEIVYSDGTVERMIMGKFVVRGEVTR